MAQTSEDYWGKRMTEREAQWYAKSQQTIEKEMADYYLQAASRIRNDIAVLYARFATDNGIDKVAAQQLIQGDEYRVWRMEMKDYLKQVQITGDKNLLLELNTLAMRSRISRLDKIYGDTMMECAKLAGKIDSRMGAFLGDAFKDNYYHGIYDIGQKMQIRTPIAAMNNEMVDKVLHTPWSGKNYSQRIWKDSDKLAQTIQREMVDAVHRGASVQQMSRMVQDRMQVGRSDATRLVRTELNYVQTQAALDSIRDAGMKYVKFLATLDDRTSEVCQQHDGKIIPIEDAKPGVNIPPLHPHCRSTITGSLKGDSISKGKRAARDADGKTVRVPASMNYEDWKRSYIGDETSVRTDKNVRTGSIKHDIITTGARNPYSKEADAHAELQYESIRRNKTDINKIADKTGYDVDKITLIKQYLFFEMHDLGGPEKARFDPDFMIAQSWQRLSTNMDAMPHDITLLKHEIYEKQLMSEGKSQSEAHLLASKKYNYAKEAEEFYARTAKHKK